MGPADLSAEGSGKVARQIERTAVQRRALGFLALAELRGMTLWFSATAVVPTLEEEWDLSTASTAWLTISVQIGFVAGTFLSAFFVFVVEIRGGFEPHLQCFRWGSTRSFQPVDSYLLSYLPKGAPLQPSPPRIRIGRTNLIEAIDVRSTTETRI